MKCLTKKEQRMIFLTIENSSSVPKYKQIVHSIIDDIEEGNLRINEQLPSINELSEEYYLSRDTVEKAYTELKERGVIKSIPGKGYFVTRTNALDKANIFLLFNKLSNYKKVIYDSFITAIGGQGNIDLHIYNNNVEIFKSKILENAGNYNYYVVIPPVNLATESVQDILSEIPVNRLILLDRCLDENNFNDYNCIFQDFEKNIYNALHSLRDQLRKYEELLLVFPENTFYPEEIKTGFKKFCTEVGFQNNIIGKIEPGYIREKGAYIVLDEDNLVQLIKNAKDNNLNLGSDVGILSYNESPFKEILFDGITVLSTDFEKMGEAVASMILNKVKGKWENPFYIIKRASL